MDFIIGLPKAKGKDTILVVVDRFSKYTHFFSLQHPFSAKDVAQTFIKGVVKLHGFPSTIVTDRDQLFLNYFWSELFKQAGTKLKYSTAYHPQIDGQTEVLKQNLDRAQQKIKCYADKKRREVEFSAGDWVYLKVQPYRLKSLARKRNEKLSPCYYGPYKILQRIGSVAYKLELPEHARIHPVFHVCLLKKALAKSLVAQPLPPALTEEWELQPLLEDVLAVRYGDQGVAVRHVFLLVRIHGNNWQPFRIAFPHFPLRTRSGPNLSKYLEYVLIRRSSLVCTHEFYRCPTREGVPCSGNQTNLKGLVSPPPSLEPLNRKCTIALDKDTSIKEDLGVEKAISGIWIMKRP
ncbi:hypothetical protein CR513_47663, partial [Mucuna pruriens]